jgi:hypothetical protein
MAALRSRILPSKVINPSLLFFSDRIVVSPIGILYRSNTNELKCSSFNHSSLRTIVAQTIACEDIINYFVI